MLLCQLSISTFRKILGGSRWLGVFSGAVMEEHAHRKIVVSLDDWIGSVTEKEQFARNLWLLLRQDIGSSVSDVRAQNKTLMETVERASRALRAFPKVSALSKDSTFSNNLKHIPSSICSVDSLLSGRLSLREVVQSYFANLDKTSLLSLRMRFRSPSMSICVTDISPPASSRLSSAHCLCF